MSDDEIRAWLALALCLDGRPDLWLALATRLGGAAETLSASDDELERSGASSKAVERLRTAASDSGRVFADCRRRGIEIAPRGSPAYPELLLRIRDAPLVLFWRGAEPAGLAPMLAMVGARRASEYAERTARRIAREAASAGIVVVSGLARGVDGAAHRGALEGGRTVAVLAGGLDHVYPGQHRELSERIVAGGGCLLSEQPPGVRPLAWLFPYRNRIITGLALATVVVEASSRSGSLASARHALDQGREVFAVPGQIDSPSCEGSNRLLVDGATPLCRIEDLMTVHAYSKLIEKLCVKRLPSLKNQITTLGPEQAAILTAITCGAATPDEMSAATALDGTRVLALLTALELDGLIRREALGRFRAIADRRGDRLRGS